MSTIKDKLLYEFANRLHKQNKKGKRKYGRSLDDCSFNDYDWESMLIEELIDGLQYQQKYIMELKDEISELKKINSHEGKTTKRYEFCVSEVETSIYNYYIDVPNNYTEEDVTETIVRVIEDFEVPMENCEYEDEDTEYLIAKNITNQMNEELDGSIKVKYTSTEVKEPIVLFNEDCMRKIEVKKLNL